MVKYKYTGSGVMSFEVDKKRYVVGKHDKRLSNVVDLPKKVDIPGMELIEKKMKGDE